MPPRKGAKRRDPPSIRLLTIGDSSVGKTCIIMQYSDKKFTANFITTIGIDYKKKVVAVKNRNEQPGSEAYEKHYTLLIWDTAGQERFKTITTSYFRGCQGILLVYSVTDRKSFENITKWMDEIKESGETHVNMILLGNKCDLESERVVSTEEGKALAAAKRIPFFETSAKTNVCIEDAFNTIAEDVVARLGDQLSKPKGRSKGKRVDLKQAKADDGGGAAGGKKGCC